MVPSPDLIKAGMIALIERNAPMTFTSYALIQLSTSASATVVPSKAPPAFATNTLTVLSARWAAKASTLA